MSTRGKLGSTDLKSMGLKATLPRLKILEIFQRWAKAEPGSSPAPPRRVRAAQAQATSVPS